MVLMAAGFDSNRTKNEEEMTIMMYLCEQMVWHNLVQKVLVGRKVKIVFVRMFLRMVDGKLSFYCHHTKELGYPWFDSRASHLPDVCYQLLVDELDLLGQKRNCDLNCLHPRKN